MLLTIIDTISDVYATDEQTYKNMIFAVDHVLQEQEKPDAKVKEAVIESKLDIAEIKYGRYKLYVVSGDKFEYHDSFIKRIKDRSDKDEITPILKQGFGFLYDDKNIWKAIESLIKSDDLKENKSEIVKRALPNIKNYSRKKRLIACLSEEEQQVLMNDEIMRKPSWTEYLFGYSKTNTNPTINKLDNTINTVVDVPILSQQENAMNTRPSPSSKEISKRLSDSELQEMVEARKKLDDKNGDSVTNRRSFMLKQKDSKPKRTKSV
jgi:hypothetical protein